MAPRRKAKETETAAPAAVSLSPRRTRSGAVAKRVAPPPAAPAKSKKKVRLTGEKEKEKVVGLKKKEMEEAEEASPATGETKSIIIEAWYFSFTSSILLIFIVEVEYALNFTRSIDKLIEILQLTFNISKQCNSFKTRALKVKGGLESAVPSISVTINPEKVCFSLFFSLHVHNLSIWHIIIAVSSLKTLSKTWWFFLVMNTYIMYCFSMQVSSSVGG
jgi:hypothetical protein